MKKSKKEKSQKQDFESKLKKIKALLKSKDIGQVCTLFLDLTEDILSGKDIIVNVKDIEELFDEILPKLKWQKDVMKNQVKLSVIRQMAKVYEKFQEAGSALKCYQNLLEKYMATITLKNFDQHCVKVYNDFANGWSVTVKGMDYLPTIDMILNRFDSEDLPKDTDLYDYALKIKAKSARAEGLFDVSQSIEFGRMEYFGSDDRGKLRIDILFEVMMDSHRLGETEMTQSTSQKVLGLIENYPEFENDPEIIDIHIETLYQHAESSSQLDRNSNFEAWQNLVDFVQSSPMAKQRIAEKPDLKNFHDIAKGHLKHGNQFQILDRLNQPIMKAKQLMDAQKYVQAIKILKDIRDDLVQLDSSQATLQRQIEVCHLIAVCHCQANEHEMAFELWTQGVLKGFKQLFLKTGSILNFEEIIMDICKCFISHLKYYDEALNLFKIDIKAIGKTSLFHDYLRLLTYKGKVKKRCNILKNYEKYSKIADGKDYNISHMFRGNLKKAFGKCPMTFHKKYFGDMAFGETLEIKTVFYFFGCRRLGLFEEAWEVIGNQRIKMQMPEIPLNAINECGVAYQIGHFKTLQSCMEGSIKSKEKLALLTQDMFESIDRLDPLRLLHWVQKNLRSENGSRKLKQQKHGIQHYHNSARIALSARKILKMDATEIIFKNYTSIHDWYLHGSLE